MARPKLPSVAFHASLTFAPLKREWQHTNDFENLGVFLSSTLVFPNHPRSRPQPRIFRGISSERDTLKRLVNSAVFEDEPKGDSIPKRPLKSRF